MIQTKKHLGYILKIRPNDLDNIVANIALYYKEIILLKNNKDGTPKLDKNGIQKKRIINPSLGKLNTTQKRILRDILSNLEMPDYAHGAVKKRDNTKNGKRHQGKKFIFTTDIRNFFPSISHSRVFNMFRQFNFSPEVSRLLTKLTTYKGKLPQGAPTSPCVSNLVFIKTGMMLQQFALDHKLTFTTFIDDITFSAPFDFKEKIPRILEIITQDGFKINHKKTSYKTRNPVVTGVVVKNNNLAVTSDFKNKLNNTVGKTEEQIRGLNLYASRVKNA